MAVAPDPTALDRSLRFRTVFNVRDLGGLPTADGRQLRRHHLLRGDGVDRIQADEMGVLADIGLRTVLDLRTEGEVERRGRFPVEHLEVDWHHLPIMRRMWSEDELEATTTAAAFLADRYLDMLDSGAQSIARIIELVASGAPALFHCAAGKDRTGVVAAVLLGLLRVPDDEIVADYHASSAAMAAFTEWIQLEHPEVADAMTSQPPEYIEAPAEAMRGFLAGVRHRHGSMETLAADLCVGPDAVGELRATLLTD